MTCAPGYLWVNKNDLYTRVCHATQYAVFESGPWYDEVEAYNQPPTDPENVVVSDDSGGSSKKNSKIIRKILIFSFFLDVALIGGVVGGVVGAIVLVAIVVGVVVMMKRRNSSKTWI